MITSTKFSWVFMALFFLVTNGVLFLNTPYIFSQSQDSVPSTMAKNVMYGEIATFLRFGWVSINYERILNDNFSVRAGLGSGYGLQLDYPAVTGVGTLLMFNYFTGRPRHRFEVGIGMSVIHLFGKVDDYTWAVNRWLFPAFAIGYRYQPRDDGFFFRAGLTFHSAFGTPLQISAGHVW